MPSTAAAAAKFRYLGITDACTTCDRCGKTELRSTIVLFELDADGNDIGEPIYYGSTCAARALAQRFGVKVSGRQALDLARAAHRQLVAQVAQSRKTVAYYDAHGGNGSEGAARECARVHRHASWGGRYGLADWSRLVTEAYDRHGAIIAEAERLGL
jgi:hypothetical protein